MNWWGAAAERQGVMSQDIRTNREDLHNEEYFKQHCEILLWFLLHPHRDDSPVIKHYLRAAVREAANHASPGPGYDNKLGAAFLSIRAADQIKSGDSKGLIGDHIVPVSVLTQMLLDLPSPRIEDIEDLLLEYGARAVITAEEHNELSKLKLRTKMPEDWRTRGPLARYNDAGIEILKASYKDYVRKAT